jgi:hypothetical protein
MSETQRGIPLRKKKYLLRDSDRSGFTHRNVELFLDDGHLVSGDEYDSPPPSDRLKPGEGDISPGDIRQAYTDYSVDSKNMAVVQYLTESSQIMLNRQVDNAGQYTYIQSTVYITGSLTAVSLVNNNQIVASDHGDRLTVQGVGSSVTLQSGSGLYLRTNVYTMESGSLLNLIYNATDSLWYETSRGETF